MNVDEASYQNSLRDFPSMHVYEGSDQSLDLWPPG